MKTKIYPSLHHEIQSPSYQSPGYARSDGSRNYRNARRMRAWSGWTFRTLYSANHSRVSPEQTEGPFFVDEKLNRSDLRVDPANGSVSPGVPLLLVLHVSQVANNSCTPVPGVTVDVWHCDALGSYSDVRDNAGGAGDTRGKKYLRGYQLTDGQGKVEFQTIYPGWYQGRNVHVHYKIRPNPSSEVGEVKQWEFTSQLFFDEAITDLVHAQPPYAQKGRRDTTNSSDGIYSRGGSDLMLALSKNAEGYTGTYKVAMLMT